MPNLKNIKEVTKVIEMFNNHIKGVVNALITTLNNAMAERLNGKIQELKTIGRGDRTFANFRRAILFFHAGLELYPNNGGANENLNGLSRQYLPKTNRFY